MRCAWARCERASQKAVRAKTARYAPRPFEKRRPRCSQWPSAYTTVFSGNHDNCVENKRPLSTKVRHTPEPFIEAGREPHAGNSFIAPPYSIGERRHQNSIRSTRTPKNREGLCTARAAAAQSATGLGPFPCRAPHIQPGQPLWAHHLAPQHGHVIERMNPTRNAIKRRRHRHSLLQPKQLFPASRLEKRQINNSFFQQDFCRQDLRMGRYVHDRWNICRPHLRDHMKTVVFFALP